MSIDDDDDFAIITTLFTAALLDSEFTQIGQMTKIYNYIRIDYLTYSSTSSYFSSFSAFKVSFTKIETQY